MRTKPWTPEERALMQREHDRWLAIGMSTEPIDVEKCEAAWAEIYRRQGYEPAPVVYARGPKEAMQKIAELSGEEEKYVGTSFLGSYEAYWVAWHRTAQALGVEYKPEDLELLAVYEQLVLHGFLAWPYEEAVVLSERPHTLHTIKTNDETYAMHREGGPAMAFADGFEIFALWGVRFDADLAQRFVVPDADTLDADEVLAIRNAEQRMCIIRRLGVERFVEKLEHDVLDTSEDGMYELLRVRLSEDVPDARYLKMRNPSVPGIYHVEGVEGDTVREALAFRNGGDFDHIAPVT